MRLTELLVCWRMAGMKVGRISAIGVLAGSLCIGVLGQTPSSSPRTSDGRKATKKFRIAQGVGEKNIIHKVQPHYPEKAKENHVTGDVILGFTIDRGGNVTDLKVLKGNPLLARAAADAVGQWKYKPYLLNGNPVEVETTAKIRFRM